MRRLEQHVLALTALSPPRCFGHPASLERAAGYIRGQWRNLQATQWDTPFTVAGQTYRNLHLLIGSAAAPRWVVGAHYDVFGENPGADDNASGVAVLIELARRLCGHPMKHAALELVAYTLEETPPSADVNMGSARHARALSAQRVDVVGMLSLEMLGYFTDAAHSQRYPLNMMKLAYPHRGNFIAVVGRLQDWRLIRAVRRAMSPSPLLLRTLASPVALAGIANSDHRHFWARGWRAAMITDTAYYRNPNYHSAADTADTLDFDRMGKVVDALSGALRRILDSSPR